MINWPFVLGVFLAKSMVFCVVLIASLAFDKLKLERGHRFIQAGLRGEEDYTFALEYSNMESLGLSST